MKDRVTRLILICTLGLFLTLSTASCAFLGSLFEDKVVTTEDNVKDEFKNTMVPAPTTGIISEEARKRMEELGKSIVLVDKGSVKDPEKAVEVAQPGSDGLGRILDVGLSIANTVWPGIAALEGIGLLVSQRKRQHYAEAVKSITPYDGDVAVKDAVVSVARAMGLAHSSEASKEAARKSE